MKAELKLLIRNIITDQLDKWSEESQPQQQAKKTNASKPVSDNPYGGVDSDLDETNAEILEELEELAPKRSEEQM